MPSTRSAARSPSRAVPRVCPTLASWSSYGFLAMISPIPRLGGPWSARASTDVFGHSPHLGQSVSVLTAPSVVILAMVRTGRKLQNRTPQAPVGRTPRAPAWPGPGRHRARLVGGVVVAPVALPLLVP